MKQSCSSTLRRNAAIGAAVAIVAASSAFGIGATAANAATGDPTSSASNGNGNGTSTSTSTGSGTSASGPGATDGATAPSATAPSATAPSTAAPTPAPATDTDTTPAADTDTGSDNGTGTGTTPAVAGTPTPETSTSATPAPSAQSATPAPAAPAAPAASTPVTWADPSSEQDPIVLTATAGQPFSHTFVAQGGDGPLEYLFDPHSDEDTGWEWNEQTGVLSGTPTSTITSTVLFEVTATDLHQSAVQYVRIEVQPAEAKGVALSIAPQDNRFVWSVYLDGVVHRSTPGAGDDTVVPAIEVRDGETISFAGLAVDEYGNRVTPGEDYPHSTGTSTNPADRVVWNDRWSSNEVTFSGTGARTVTISEGGVSTMVPIEVTAAPEAGAVTGFAIGVLPGDGSGDRYGVLDGVVTRYAEDGTSERVDAIPARQGDRVQVRALAVDAEGNPVGDHRDLTFTSSVASDRIEYDAEQAATWVTFEHASPHVITVASQGVSATIPFEVAPVAAPAATTPTVGSSTPTASGHLAYTGADESGPLGWALGLLAAGVGLLVHRIRRRRA